MFCQLQNIFYVRHLKSNIIKRIYLNSDQEVILGEIEVFTSENEDNYDFIKDVSNAVSLGLLS